MVKTVDGARLNAADLHGRIAAIRIKCRADKQETAALSEALRLLASGQRR